MSFTEQLRGLYAITDPILCGEQLIIKAEQAIAGGVRILQYRNKLASETQQLSEARALCELCREHGVTFIVNDNAELAAETNAHGVHVGQTDHSIPQARAILGPDRIIGISCNNLFEYALTARQQGADYVAFGRFFPSGTKPDAPQADIALLSRARQELSLPVVAIGGIRLENARMLIDAGAQMLAVIEGIFAQPDIRQASQSLSSLFP